MLRNCLRICLRSPTFSFPDPKGSVEAYAVVREAMVQAGKVAIGEVAFGGREHLVAIVPAPGKNARGLMAYTLRYAEELRDAKTYFGNIHEDAIDKKQLALANELIRAQSAPFHLEDFKDDYEAALREFIEAKRKREIASRRRGKAACQGHQSHGRFETQRQRVEPEQRATANERRPSSNTFFFAVLKERPYTGEIR